VSDWRIGVQAAEPFFGATQKGKNLWIEKKVKHIGFQRPHRKKEVGIIRNLMKSGGPGVYARAIRIVFCFLCLV